jgi:protoheme IX farnesyltransferase
MIIVGVLPAFGITGDLTLSVQGAVLVVVLGGWVLINAMKLFKSGDDSIARKLMLSSIGYLTGMQLIYVMDRFI